MGELGEALGLENAWTGDVDPAYGLGQTDVEGMSEVGDATFFYTGTVDPAGDINAALADNAVWKKIPAVAEGRAHAFPEGIWTFGGPRSAQQVIDASAKGHDVARLQAQDRLDRNLRRPDLGAHGHVAPEHLQRPLGLLALVALVVLHVGEADRLPAVLLVLQRERGRRHGQAPHGCDWRQPAPAPRPVRGPTLATRRLYIPARRPPVDLTAKDTTS